MVAWPSTPRSPWGSDGREDGLAQALPHLPRGARDDGDVVGSRTGSARRSRPHVVIDAPGPPEVLHVREVPTPSPQPGEVLIRVKAFGLNRSELHFRRGVASNGSFPRVPGIEASGVVEEAPDGEFSPGTQVATLMGGMGREFDGGYAEFVVVPAGQVIAFHSELPWATLGALPEMLQTAYGSLEVGVRPESGDRLLIRGGTASVGLALAVLGKQRGLTVLSTTRREAGRKLLEKVGVDHVLIDDGNIAAHVLTASPGGVDGAVELVGVNVLRDTLGATRPGGTVCFTGMLSDQWTIDASIRWTGFPTACDSPHTQAAPPTYRPRSCSSSSTPSPSTVPSCRPARPTESTTSCRPIATWRPAP